MPNTALTASIAARLAEMKAKLAADLDAVPTGPLNDALKVFVPVFQDQIKIMEDFLKVIIDAEEDETGSQMTAFEKEFGHDPKLALRIVTDPFKAPEQKKEAQEFLESLDL